MLDYLHSTETKKIISAALAEDIGDGDHSSLSTIPEHLNDSAYCLIKDQGIIAGVSFARKIFETIDKGLEFEAYKSDGDEVEYGDKVFSVHGSARHILTAERTVLNFMQRMSGIATLTRRVVDQLDGLDCKILDTRKTTPLVRHIEKWAVAIGGGTNHRFGLYDMIMIKDNHIDYAGGISAAIQACKAYLATHQLSLKIEIETRTIEEVKEVLSVGGVDIIMLDNMSIEEMREAVALIGGRAETEASGGISIDRVREVAETGVDAISMGALTHSVKSLDMSLKAMR